MSCRPLDVESFRNRARLPKGITRRKRAGYDESKKVSRTLLRPERKFQVDASRGNTQEFDQAQQAIDLEPMIGVEQETLRIGAVPTGLPKPGGDPRAEQNRKRVGNPTASLHL